MSLEVVMEWSFIAIALIGYYVTFIHYKWWKLYRPSPLIRHLLISSIAVDVASTIMAALATILLLNIEIPREIRLMMVSTALFIGLGVKIYRRVNLRQLDNPNEDVVQRVETQNQREDRQFGEERRALEVEHMNSADETANQRDDREVGDAKRAEKTVVQEAINDAN